MESMKRIIKYIDKLNNIVGNIVKFLLLYMALTLVYEVVMRYFFNKPTIWVFDLCKQALGFIGALGGGYTLLYNSHVKVDVIYTNLSLKTRAILDLITSVLFFIFIGVLIWKSTEMAVNSWALKEHAVTVLAPPLYFVKTAIPIGAVLVLLQGIAKVLRDILVLKTGQPQEHKALDG